ncbi:MAG: ketopantoate reductase family protein [Anaerolineae bacterium]
MRALIVGAGAIGSLVGYKLARAGNEVTLVGRQPYVAAVRVQGLGLEGGGQVAQAMNVRAVTNVRDVADEPFDFVLLTVKAYDTTEASAQVEPLAQRGIPILVLQNGVGGEETAAEILGKATILSAVITLSVEVLEPGLVRLATTRGGIGLAPTTSGQSVAELAEVFREAGFRTSIYRDYRRMKWSKLLLNIVANASPAILDMFPDEVFADSRLFALERAAFREGAAVMRALGLRPVSLPGYPVPLFAWALCSLPAWLLRPILRRAIVPGRGGKMPSLHIDLSRGKGKSEVECLNGAVVRYAQELGLDAPVNRALHSVLMGIVKRGIPWEEYRGQPERLLETCPFTRS